MFTFSYRLAVGKKYYMVSHPPLRGSSGQPQFHLTDKACRITHTHTHTFYVLSVITLWGLYSSQL